MLRGIVSCTILLGFLLAGSLETTVDEAAAAAVGNESCADGGLGLSAPGTFCASANSYYSWHNSGACSGSGGADEVCVSRGGDGGGRGYQTGGDVEVWSPTINQDDSCTFPRDLTGWESCSAGLPGETPDWKECSPNPGEGLQVYTRTTATHPNPLYGVDNIRATEISYWDVEMHRMC